MELFQTIGELSAQLNTGERTAIEVCNSFLAAIRSTRVGAFSDLLGETAAQEAEASDARRREGQALGPLDGIPVAIKDLIDTHPAICKAGLTHLSDHRPPTDAAVVQRLRKAGAVIIGVTETDPGAFSTETPQVVNPLAPDRTAGGSSGGSAAAIAAGLVPCAIGTDTGGSIRIPAACCSIYGFKPTWGRVDATGVRPLAHSLDHVGPLARNVADLRILQRIIEGAGSEPLDDTASPQLRLGLCEAYFEDADPAIKDAMRSAISLLGASGAAFEKTSLPLPDEILPFHMVNLPREAAIYHQSFFPDEWPSYPDIARATVELGNTISLEAYERAQESRRRCRLAVNAEVDRVDAIVVPTMPIDAPLKRARLFDLGGRTLSKLEATIRYTALFNQTGHPVVSMPAVLLPDGRALSIQLVGSHGEDEKLLTIAQKIETILSINVNYAAIIAGRYPMTQSTGTPAFRELLHVQGQT